MMVGMDSWVWGMTLILSTPPAGAKRYLPVTFPGIFSPGMSHPANDAPAMYQQGAEVAPRLSIHIGDENRM